MAYINLRDNRKSMLTLTWVEYIAETVAEIDKLIYHVSERSI